MNKITLLGRLTKDPELRQIPGDNPVNVTRFTLAVRHPFRKDQADFIPCEVYGKRAEVVNEYLHKGSRILISDGRLEITNKQLEDGSYRTYVNVHVNDFEFVDTKADEAANTQPAPKQEKADADFVLPDDVEGLPFI